MGTRVRVGSACVCGVACGVQLDVLVCGAVQHGVRVRGAAWCARGRVHRCCSKGVSKTTITAGRQTCSTAAPCSSSPNLRNPTRKRAEQQHTSS
eukprot:6213009-Pleurochrysis_carterae.AAC.6